jgi:hypothetical protein
VELAGAGDRDKLLYVRVLLSSSHLNTGATNEAQIAAVYMLILQVHTT